MNQTEHSKELPQPKKCIRETAWTTPHKIPIH